MKKQGKSRWNLLVTALLLVLFAGVLAAVMFFESAPAEPTVPTTAQTTPAETTPPTTTVPPTTQPPAPAKRLNFLLIGRDWHDEGERGRSDAMILCSFETGEGTVSLISFLRDIYLPIPGHGSNRLNSAYSWGGTELLTETLQENFGVELDACIEIDFDGFEELIDYLGGVDVTLTDREARYLNKNHGWSLPEGMSRLTGEQALHYSRIRYLDSDFVRTERQRNVLLSLMGRFRDAGLNDMLRYTDKFLDQSTSDRTDEELISWAMDLYPLLGSSTVSTHQIPAEGTYAYETIRGMSVIDVDLEENRQLLAELLPEPKN